MGSLKSDTDMAYTLERTSKSLVTQMTRYDKLGDSNNTNIKFEIQVIQMWHTTLPSDLS
jgi:hypothetical protein